MIHYNETNGRFTLILANVNIVCSSLLDLQRQSKLYYKFDCLTLLN